MAKTGRGKSENFSDDQIDALRKTLAAIKSPKETQDELGERLGVDQRTISRLLDMTKDAGCTYRLATSIARASGASGVDELFRLKGVDGALKKTNVTNPSLSVALVYARTGLRMPEWLVQNVIDDVGGMTTPLKTSTWSKHFARAAELWEDSQNPPPPPVSREQVEREAIPVRRKKAAGE